jgi:hypothetical protein
MKHKFENIELDDESGMAIACCEIRSSLWRMVKNNWVNMSPIKIMAGGDGKIDRLLIIDNDGIVYKSPVIPAIEVEKGTNLLFAIGKLTVRPIQIKKTSPQ